MWRCLAEGIYAADERRVHSVDRSEGRRSGLRARQLGRASTRQISGKPSSSKMVTESENFGATFRGRDHIPLTEEKISISGW